MVPAKPLFRLASFSFEPGKENSKRKSGKIALSCSVLVGCYTKET
jgi:hypothetical protein